MLSLNKNKHFPASLHDAVLIFSDLESSNVLALKFLKKYLNALIPILLVVNEGNMNKRQIGINIMNYYGYENFQVLDDINTEKNYPSEICNLYPYHSQSVSTTDSTISIKAFIEKYNSPLIIAMSPFYSLMGMPNNLLNKCVLMMYGSYNLRSMYYNTNQTQVFNFINDSFKHVLLYESYHATKDYEHHNQYKDLIDNNLRQLIELCNKVALEDALHVIINTANRLLNKVIKETEIDELEIDNARLHRNTKMVHNIIKTDYRYIGMTEPCLITYAFNAIKFGKTKKGKLRVDEKGYSQIEVDEKDGKVYLVHDLDVEELLAWMRK